MTLKFKGFVEQRKRGCPVCGNRTIDGSYVTSKMFILPSGKTMTFRVGRKQEVSDADGEFLLSLKDKQGKPVFEVI